MTPSHSSISRLMTLGLASLLLLPTPALAGGFVPPALPVGGLIPLTPLSPVLTNPTPRPTIPAPTGPKVALVINAGEEFDDQVRDTVRALQSRGYSIRLLSHRGATHTLHHTTDLITRMLRSANPGDTVVLSLHAHGVNEDAGNPRLGTREVRWEQHSIELQDSPFFTTELKELIDRYKKPGVRVVVMSWSCSGGSTVLAFENTPEVCAISGTTHIGPGGTGDPAAATLFNPKNFTFLDAANEAERWFLATPGANDRIHQRQYTSGCSEESQHFRNALATANVALGDWELQNSPFNAWIYPDRKPMNTRSLLEVNQLALQRILQLSVEYYDHYRPHVASRVASPDFISAYKRSAPRILSQYRNLKLSPRFLAGSSSPRNLLSNLDRIVEEAASRFQELSWVIHEVSRIARNHGGRPPTTGPDAAYFQALRASVVELRAQIIQFNTEANPMLNLFEEIDCSTKNSACSAIAI